MNTSTHTKIHFLDYQIDVTRRSVHRGDQILAITNLGFEVLCFLAEHAGELVTRDQLVCHAWKNKIITDATLYKQIQRLRKQLGDTGETRNIIQTLHGQGFIFLPEVTDGVNVSLNETPLKTNYLKNLMMLMGAAVLFYTVLSFTRNEEQNAPVMNMDAVAEPLILSVLPDRSQLEPEEQSWMAYGGMHYLIDKFQNNIAVKINKLSKTQLTATDTEKNAIKLTHNRTIDVALVLQVTEQNNQFLSKVILRNTEGIIANESFSSVAIKELLDQIYLWTNSQLKLDNSNLPGNSLISENRYAVENFIRGMSAQFAGNAAQAIKYFELATEVDDQFWKAWYELSIAYRKQGEHSKSIAILSTLEQTDEAGPLHLGVQNAKAVALWRLGEHREALAAIDNTIKIAEAENTQIVHILLTNKSIIAAEMGDLAIAEKAIKRSIELIGAFPEHKPRSLGSAYNTLAGINQRNNDLELAQINAEKAIDYFMLANEHRYELTSKSRLASIHLELGNHKIAKHMINRVLTEQQKLADISGQISNQIKLAHLFIKTGEFSVVLQTLDKIAVLLNETSNEYLQNQFLAIQIQYHILMNEEHHVPNLLSQLKGKHINDEQLLNFSLLELEYYYNKQAWSAFDQSLNSIKQELTNHPMINFWRSQYATAHQNQAKAVSAMQNAFDDSGESRTKRQTRIKILNAFSHMIINSDITKAKNLNDQCEGLNPPSYPFLKIKAMINASTNHHFEAASLMQELKMKAGDYWSADDQLMLEEFQHQLNTNSTESK